MILASDFAKAIEQAVIQARQTGRRQRVKKLRAMWGVQEVGVAYTPPARDWFGQGAYL